MYCECPTIKCWRMYCPTLLTYINAYIYNWFCYTCVDLMPKLERIQQVMMNVARKTKEVRMKYLCKWRNSSNSDCQCPVTLVTVCNTREFYVITQFRSVKSLCHYWLVTTVAVYLWRIILLTGASAGLCAWQCKMLKIFLSVSAAKLCQNQLKSLGVVCLFFGGHSFGLFLHISS